MKVRILFCILLIGKLTVAQNFEFLKNTYKWSAEIPKLDQMDPEFSAEDLVILKEDVSFDLRVALFQTLTKHCFVKVNSKNGIEKLSSFTLPESFDPAADIYGIKQGRESKNRVPFIYGFKIKYFAARVLKGDGSLVDLSPKVTTKKVTWRYEDGKEVSDYNYNFSLPQVQVGDIVEYTYQIEFRGRYGGNLFYFNGELPKQQLNFDVKLHATRQLEKFDIICNRNGADSNLVKTLVDGGNNQFTQVYTYSFHGLKAVHYIGNACVGVTLPSIFIDLNFVSYVGYSLIPEEALVYANRGAHFEWLLLSTVYVAPALYDSEHANVRKFISALPVDPESKDVRLFLNSLIDTLNSYKYVSAEQMHYSGNAQYSVNPGGWLLKRTIMGEFMYDLYWQILDEKKYEKYYLDVVDRRLGIHDLNKRSSLEYERTIIVVKDGNSFVYVTPRANGMKFHTDEIPFYFEGNTGALMNYDDQTVQHSRLVTAKVLGFIKVPESDENQNVRIENAVVEVKRDSLKMNLKIKENLLGQFSTIVRPLYLKEAIDSSISPAYFKLATDKPGATGIKIENTSKSTQFPYKYSFACSEEIPVSDLSSISLVNWFSFPFELDSYGLVPNFDYYLDFRFTDNYNYMIKFDKPTEILNASLFNQSVDNENFELISTIVKQDDLSYLLKVSCKVKNRIVKKENAKDLNEFIAALSGINHFSLQIK